MKKILLKNEKQQQKMLTHSRFAYFLFDVLQVLPFLIDGFLHLNVISIKKCEYNKVWLLLVEMDKKVGVLSLDLDSNPNGVISTL